MKGLISQIQHYSTKDGPGIRTTVFFMGCNLRCKWCANPETILPGKKVMYHKQKCMRCGTCVQAAASSSIRLGEDGCVIDRELCTNLEDMVYVCPYDAYEERGREIEAEELRQKLNRDIIFYRNSGGGVTFSGGEACLQRDFLLEVMGILKQDGIHIALDTAGNWEFEKVLPLIELADLVLYDIKAFDSGLHCACTGVGNERILENALKIAGMKKNMHIRLVLVPGVNDQREDVLKRFRFVKSLGDAVKQTDLLPYHRLGVGKYQALGIPYELTKVREYGEDEIEKLRNLAQKERLTVTVGG